MPVDFDYSQYHIQCRQEQPPAQKKLLQKMQNMGVNVFFYEYPPHWFIIPPRTAAFHLHSQDMRTKSTEVIITKLMEFLKEYPEAIIIAEGFHRWGKANQEKWQQLMMQLFFQVISENTDLTSCFGPNSSSSSSSSFTSTISIFPRFIPTRNAEDSVELLLRIAHREQVSDVAPTLSRVAGKRVFLAEAQEFFIQGLLNCGKKKAKQLLEKFDTPAAIFDTILNNPSEVAAIPGFGEKFIEANRKMLSEILPFSKNNPSDTTLRQEYKK